MAQSPPIERSKWFDRGAIDAPSVRKESIVGKVGSRVEVAIVACQKGRLTKMRKRVPVELWDAHMGNIGLGFPLAVSILC